MSEHLFADLRTTRTPSRQSSLVLASIVVHLVALLALLLVELLAPGVLPVPHVVLAWSEPRLVKLADIPLPPQRSTLPPTPKPPDTSSNAAPVVAPTGVAPEVDRPLAPIALPGVVDGPANTDIGAILAPPSPPPAAPQPSVPIRLHSGIDAPVKVRDVRPVYPAIARTAGATGVVIVEATVDANGEVVNTRLLRSIPLLDDAAIDAVRQWKYTPAKLNGEPVSVLITVTVNFTLGR